MYHKDEAGQPKSGIHRCPVGAKAGVTESRMEGGHYTEGGQDGYLSDVRFVQGDRVGWNDG